MMEDKEKNQIDNEENIVVTVDDLDNMLFNSSASDVPLVDLDINFDEIKDEAEIKPQIESMRIGDLDSHEEHERTSDEIMELDIDKIYQKQEEKMRIGELNYSDKYEDSSAESINLDMDEIYAREKNEMRIGELEDLDIVNDKDETSGGEIDIIEEEANDSLAEVPKEEESEIRIDDIELPDDAKEENHVVSTDNISKYISERMDESEESAPETETYEEEHGEEKGIGELEDDETIKIDIDALHENIAELGVVEETKEEQSEDDDELIALSNDALEALGDLEVNTEEEKSSEIEVDHTVEASLANIDDEEPSSNFFDDVNVHVSEEELNELEEMATYEDVITENSDIIKVTGEKLEEMLEDSDEKLIPEESSKEHDGENIEPEPNEITGLAKDEEYDGFFDDESIALSEDELSILETELENSNIAEEDNVEPAVPTDNLARYIDERNAIEVKSDESDAEETESSQSDMEESIEEIAAKASISDFDESLIQSLTESEEIAKEDVEETIEEDVTEESVTEETMSETDKEILKSLSDAEEDIKEELIDDDTSEFDEDLIKSLSDISEDGNHYDSIISSEDAKDIIDASLEDFEPVFSDDKNSTPMSYSENSKSEKADEEQFSKDVKESLISDFANEHESEIEEDESEFDGSISQEDMDEAAILYEQDEKDESSSSEKDTFSENASDVKTTEETEDIKRLLSYLDELLGDLPEDKIKEFAESEYYDIYAYLMKRFGV